MPMPVITGPVNKVYLGQPGTGVEPVVVMDISDSDLDVQYPADEYGFHGVKSRLKYFDKNGRQGEGDAPYDKVLVTQTTPPASETPNYIITIVTASSTNDNNAEDESVDDNNDATNEVTEE